MKVSTLFVVGAALGSVLAGINPALAQGTAFTYQGRLNDGASPASGSYDLTFALFSVSSGAGQVGGTLTSTATAVSNGLFTVTLDFGNQFPGADRWLEIGVRTNGGGTFSTLTPRQKLAATPYAITAGNVTGTMPATQLSGTLASAQLAGTYTGSVNFSNPGNSFGGGFAGNGAGLSNVNATALGGLGSGSFWQTSGNAGTTPGANFLGTTDHQPLELRVGGRRALRLEPTDDNAASSNLVNVVGGSPNNYVAPNVMGATIGGGGALLYGFNTLTNSVGDNLATISGGGGNGITPGGFAGTIGGGYQNTVGMSYGTVGGGYQNTSTNNYATISGGEYNTSSGFAAFVGAGVLNISSGNSSTLGGGADNRAGGDYSVVGGGSQNINDTGNYSVVGGGLQNTIFVSDYQTIAGGHGNQASATGATVGGGGVNISSGSYSTIAGGIANSTVGGYSSVGGGQNNLAFGNDSAIPGGSNNTAGVFSLAAGHSAKALGTGTFIWADSQNADFQSIGNDQFLIRAQGGVGINTNNPNGVALNVAGTLQATAFQGAFSGNGAGLTNTTTAANYVFAYSTSAQTVATANTFQDITFNHDDQINGWTHTSGAAEYTNAQSGLYLIEYTAKAVAAAVTGSTNISVVALLNATQIPGSQTASQVGLSTPIMLSKSFIANLSAADVLKLQFTGPGTGISLNSASGSGNSTTKSSISMTIVRIQ